METGHLRMHEGEHFSVSHLYDQSILETSDNGFLEIMEDDSSFHTTHIVDPNDLWDNGLDYNDVAVLPMQLGLEGQFDTHSKEDFQKMLTEWHDQVGTAPDNFDVDVKDIADEEMVMTKTIELTGLFDANSELKTIQSPEKLYLPSKNIAQNNLELSLSFDDRLNTFNLENFLEDDDEEEQKFGLIVAEEEASTKKLKAKKDIRNQTTEIAIKDEVNIKDAIKVEFDAENEKSEAEDDSIDVETITEQIPVLQAGDLKSLLEQFEASEAFNTNNSTSDTLEVPTGNSHVLKNIPQPIKQSDKKPVTTNQENSVLSHETIRDSLPKEVIDRIKASNRKKAIPVIPAMPNKRAGRGATRMQDAAATFNRNKLLKIVSGTGKGESYQLDHDYCSYIPKPNMDLSPVKSFYHSDASDYMPEGTKATQSEENSDCVAKDKVYSRLPDYYVVLAPPKVVDKNKTGPIVKEDNWDKNSRKDSGLESGDVSDASEDTVVASGTSSSQDSMCILLNSVVPKIETKTAVKNWTSPDLQGRRKVASVDTQTIKFSNMERRVSKVISTESQRNMDRIVNHQNSVKSKPAAMVSVLKKSHINNNINNANTVPNQQSLLINSNINVQGSVNIEIKKTDGPKKRKLNLEEYRSRIKELGRSRNIVSKVDNTTTTNILSSLLNIKSSTSETSAQICDISKDNGANEVKTTVDETEKIKPVMHSVEVQTQTSSFEETAQEDEKQKERRSRKQQRKYCSRRASSSSSCHSGSSSNSHRHRKRSLSRRRRRRRSKSRNSGSPVSSSESQRSRSNSSHSSSSYSRSRSPNHDHYKANWVLSEKEKQRQVEERRVIYVGRIEEGTSKAELRRRFQMFGPIIDISVHFREHGDNYGFVTFAYKVDAYEAIEHGNDDPNLPRYDLCFGGRRAFCKTRYADLDGMATSDDHMSSGYSRNTGSSFGHNYARSEDFDLLLREAQAKLQKRNV